MDEREKRLAQNEVLFREVNERINDVAHQLGDEVPYEYFCECANADCSFRLMLIQAEYEAVRADPTQFAVLPGHYTPEVEILVSETETYCLVQENRRGRRLRRGTRPPLASKPDAKAQLQGSRTRLGRPSPAGLANTCDESRGRPSGEGTSPG